MTECILQGGLNALHLAAIGNHVEVVRALVREFGVSVTHKDNVSCTFKLQYIGLYVVKYGW